MPRTVSNRRASRPATPPAPPANQAMTAKGDASASTDLTPAMRQYLEQKSQVGDALLLFRMGDFYETFYEDAKTLARVLGLTLTARSKNAENPVPLAGVPYHSIDAYVARLVRAGYKVAISEQIEDPRTAKGVVKRAVQRIITPGTLTEDALLDERAPNHLVALCPDKSGWTAGRIGLACIELASGRFFAEMVPADALLDDLARLRPAEVIVPEAPIESVPSGADFIRDAVNTAVTPRGAHVFNAHMADQALRKHFSVATLAGFGFDEMDRSLCAAAAILDYLRETQKGALAHILTLTPRHSDRCLMLDHVTLRSLEVERTLRDGNREGSLLHAIDLTVNPMGARRLRDWLCFPLLDAGEIVARQDAIADLLHHPDRLRGMREIIRSMGDMQRIIARLGVGRATPRDMVVLGRGLLHGEGLADAIGPAVGRGQPADRMNSPDLLSALHDNLTGLRDLADYMCGALKPDAPQGLRDPGFINSGFNAELDRLRNIGVDGRQWLAEYQSREAKRTGIPTLKVGYNSVFGFYIEITHQHREKIPPEYVRKQTVRNAERYITDDLKRHEDEVLSAADRAQQLELDLFDRIRARAAESLSKLQQIADAVATLDVLAALAELARTRDYCRPDLVVPHSRSGQPETRSQKPETLEIIDGRHPVLDAAHREVFVPNDCALLPGKDQFLIITGPNMAGKSTYIRQVALLTLLAHTGSYVPAKSMRWSPVDRIFARVGANDELARGLSTFMVEMVETTRILHNATPRSLVILDEIGRGTSTYDGLSLAWAITEHVADRIGCRTLFATHYHELTELANPEKGIANFNVAVHEELRPDGTGRDVVFLHRIVAGAADRSYGVHVAAMAGMSASVVK
ncbi:MAG TPA: DNA mismatch repair protein MutS, partial [Phycisphaerae bacterium]|nr:DNA mismatch repair protein MutS [Phycisphaerae bacterium]